MIGIKKMKTSIHMVLAILALFSSTGAFASLTGDLKRLEGYTIIHGGFVKSRIERDYNEKLLQLDNGWTFKLNCLILMPLNFTDVVVLGKRYPDELLRKFPSLPKNLQYEFKLVIDGEICDVTAVQ